MAHLRNEEKPFSYEKFRPKSAFIPKNKDNITEKLNHIFTFRIVLNPFSTVKSLNFATPFTKN